MRMDANSFVSIESDEPCQLEIPEPVTIPVSEMHGKMAVTKMVSASKGTRDYEKVLVTWMFIHGYILKDGTQESSEIAQ
jgi:hypothetical protein